MLRLVLDGVVSPGCFHSLASCWPSWNMSSRRRRTVCSLSCTSNTPHPHCLHRCSSLSSSASCTSRARISSPACMRRVARICHRRSTLACIPCSLASTCSSPGFGSAGSARFLLGAAPRRARVRLGIGEAPGEDGSSPARKRESRMPANAIASDSCRLSSSSSAAAAYSSVASRFRDVDLRLRGPPTTAVRVRDRPRRSISSECSAAGCCLCVSPFSRRPRRDGDLDVRRSSLSLNVTVSAGPTSVARPRSLCSLESPSFGAGIRGAVPDSCGKS
mmetsp:Transcript_32460/g.65841  ORF Transcript_32460/g.65841 Transcript_32460/m.65841 type:complete len:275 (-) Transcript_32460:825-1649(-)